MKKIYKIFAIFAVLFSTFPLFACTGNTFEVANKTFVVDKVETRLTVETTLSDEQYWIDELKITNESELLKKTKEYFTEQYKETTIIFTDTEVTINEPANKTFKFKQTDANIALTNLDNSDTIDRFKFRNSVLRYLIYANGLEVEFELKEKE